MSNNDRDQRIALSQMHVNPLKWMGMAFLGLLTLTGNDPIKAPV